MRYSKMFGKTEKTISGDMKTASHKFLFKAGFVRESTAGRYYFLPLGMRVFNKIVGIVREEMNAAGGQEMISPILHPLELWQETNRTSSAGFELMQITDRRGGKFALGGTAEEMFVDVVRKYQLSYKDLPFNIYQFSPKFRDELRARGGLLRVREFVMKDAYSFHKDKEDFAKEYKNMWDTYLKIYKRVGLDALPVAADNGYIGGEYCHEFIVESDAGESKFFTSEDGSYVAHEDVASFKKYAGDDASEEEKPLEEVIGEGIIGVEALAKHLGIPAEKTTKTILFETEKGEVIAAAIMGLYDINETKLKKIIGCAELKLAEAETVTKVTGAKVGYAGILNLPADVRIFMDDSMQGRKNFEMGANKTDYHTINVNFGRDIKQPEQFYDFALVKEGYESAEGQKLSEKNGIEVGNIFQLGLHYSKLMHDAEFTDENGQRVPYYMGCYGIGLGRTLATIVEKHHDDKGIIWPEAVAPYQIHLIGLDLEIPEIKAKAEAVYQKLLADGKEVLFDDRVEVMAGQKFNDADLIGIPTRMVVSKRSGDQVEVKQRDSKESSLITI